MAYRKVYFRIRTDCYSSGWTSDADRTAFKEESRRLFQELGWAVTFGHNGSCDTAAKEQLSKARTFRCYHVDRYEEYRDLSDEAYRAELEAKRDEITSYVLEKCRTKRSNLYIVDPVAIHVAEHFAILRLCDKDKRNKIGNQFVAELMDQLLQKGWLVSAKTSHGDGIRTATNKERGISRQPAAQVDGQITMEDQENKAPKKKKGRKPAGSCL